MINNANTVFIYTRLIVKLHVCWYLGICKLKTSYVPCHSLYFRESGSLTCFTASIALTESDDACVLMTASSQLFLSILYKSCSPHFSILAPYEEMEIKNT